jgi:hypothetical protein
MASMGDMPDVARKVMPLCSGHRFILRKRAFFALEKRVIGPFQGLLSGLFVPISNTCRGPTPDKARAGFASAEVRVRRPVESVHLRIQGT